MKLEVLQKAKEIEKLIDSIKSKILGIEKAIQKSNRHGEAVEYNVSIINLGNSFVITQKEFIKLANKKIAQYENQMDELEEQLEKL